MLKEHREKLQQAFDLLTDWLLDRTEDAFEEELYIDEARSLIDEVLKDIEKRKEG